MANLTSVGVTSGVPSSGTGAVSTIDNLIGTAGTASAQVLSVQGVTSGTVIPVSLASAPSTAVTNAGTFATQLTGATNNINNVAGTVSLPTGASTSALQTTGNTSLATVAAANLTIGSTTSGQAGHLAMGAVTTGAPTYTTAQTNPLSLDTSGNLRVNVVAGGGSGGTSLVDEATFTEGTSSYTPIGGTFKTSQTPLTTGQGGAVALSAAREILTVSKNWDGTNTAAVKAASTAPLATDPALVVAISPNSVNANGRALPASSAPVVMNSQTYKAVAASATATLLGTTGATGDYLDGVLIIPATAAAGAVSITDGSGSAITIFAGGGTTALPTLAPFFVPIGAVSSGGTGGWKVTTGTNVSVIGVGNFT